MDKHKTHFNGLALFYGQNTIEDPIFGDANPDYGRELYQQFVAEHPDLQPLMIFTVGRESDCSDFSDEYISDEEFTEKIEAYRYAHNKNMTIEAARRQYNVFSWDSEGMETREEFVSLVFTFDVNENFQDDWLQYYENVEQPDFFNKPERTQWLD